MVDVPNRPEYQSELFKQGLAVRRDVLGADYVDASLARADDFNAAFQQMTTEIAQGEPLGVCAGPGPASTARRAA